MNVTVTGHRPQSLGGFGQKKKFQEIKAKLKDQLLELKPNMVTTGMALGLDQWIAELCVELKIPFIAALPCENQERVWPPKSQQHYQWLLSKAKKIVMVDRIPGYINENYPPGVYHGSKMLVRNLWMIDQMGPKDCLLSLWDRSKTSSGTGHCIEYFNSKHSFGTTTAFHINISPHHFDDLPF